MNRPHQGQVLSFPAWKQSELARTATLAKAVQSRSNIRYNPVVADGLPDHPWFRFKRRDADEQLRDLVMRVLSVIRKARPENVQMHRFGTSVNDIRSVSLDDSYVVTFSGHQGVGKSTLLNALLLRDGLVDASGGGGACTAFLMKIQHSPKYGDRETKSDVEIHYKKPDKLRTMFEEQAQNFGAHIFNDVPGIEEARAVRDRAIEAQHIIRCVETAMLDKNEAAPISCNEQDHGSEEEDLEEDEEGTEGSAEEEDPVGLKDETLKSLLTPQNLANGTFVNALVEKSGQIIDERSNNGIWTGDGILDKDLKLIQARAQKIWPLVSCMIIRTGGLLLRNNLSAWDSPGVGDAFQTRAAAGLEARRAAQHECIVVNPKRAKTEPETAHLVEDSEIAHGSENTTVLFNGIDDTIYNPQIWAELAKLGKRMPAAIVKNYRKLKDSKEPDDLRMKYMAYLRQLGVPLLIAEREQATKKEMKRHVKCMGFINVFSTSARLYASLVDPLLPKDEWTSEDSGIPQVRRFLLELTANDNLAAYEKHLTETAPHVLVVQLQTLLSSFEDEHGYASARNHLKTHIPMLGAGLQALYAKHRLSLRPQFLPPYHSIDYSKLRRTIELVHDQTWGTLHWSTYDLVIRDGGIPLYSQSQKLNDVSFGRKNLNWHLKDAFISNLVVWKADVHGAAASFAKLAGSMVDEVVFDMGSKLRSTDGNIKLFSRAVGEWTETYREISRLTSSLPVTLSRAVDHAYADIILENCRTGTIAVLLKQVYEDAKHVERGPGFHGRQKQILRSGLLDRDPDGKTFMERYEDRVLQGMENALHSKFQSFNDAVNGLLTRFLGVMHTLISYDNENIDFAVRDELEAMIPTIEEDLSSLARLVKDARDGAGRNEDQNPGPAKRARCG